MLWTCLNKSYTGLDRWVDINHFSALALDFLIRLFVSKLFKDLGQASVLPLTKQMFEVCFTIDFSPLLLCLCETDAGIRPDKGIVITCCFKC